MRRRRFLSSGVAVVTFAASGASYARTDWDAWADLLNMLPSKDDLNAVRRARGTDSADFDIQKIEDAESEKINFDFYAVDIQKLPGQMSAESLLAHVRKNLNSFLDHSYSEVIPSSEADARDWGATDSAPLGALMQFNIPVLGPVVEQAAVVVSKSSNSSWIFTPVTFGFSFPGEHPVSGNREFGLLSKEGLAARLYTRGADRAIDNIFPDEDTVYGGADSLWKSFQKLVADYVNSNGGTASVGNRVVKQPLWTDVRASGLFERA